MSKGSEETIDAIEPLGGYKSVCTFHKKKGVSSGQEEFKLFFIPGRVKRGGNTWPNALLGSRVYGRARRLRPILVPRIVDPGK